MARRKVKSQTGAWIVLATVVIAIVGLGTQFAPVTWPYLLVVVGGLAGIWRLIRRQPESRSAARPTLHPAPMTSIDPEATQLSTHLVVEAPQIVFGKRGTGFDRPQATAPEKPARPALATRARAEPEFRITAIAEPPPELHPRTEPRPAAAPRGAARWIPAGVPVTIHDLTIVSGMIYVGNKLGNDRWRSENCLIDPTLPVARPGRGSADGIPYWARYDAVTPVIRRAYLEWLAAGRPDGGTEIGLVFLFFYGLEYRLFKEGALSDGPAIVAEVERLRASYGAGNSFEGYASRFLEAAQFALSGVAEIRPDVVLDHPIRALELPLDIRAWLGRKLAAGETLDPDDALLWLAALPDRNFRTPVTRCQEEFRTLWRLRFAQIYPTGLRVNAPKTRLKATYRAASGTFEVPLKGALQDLPDIAAVTSPVRKLRDLVEACTKELDAYSRFIGKRPDARSSTEAALLLPRDVTLAGTAWDLVTARLGTLLTNRETAPVPLADLFAIVGLSLLSPGRVPQAPMLQLGQVLDRLDVGFEPDRRYGGPLLEASSTVCLFRAENGAPIDSDRPEYRTARDLIDIACLAAASDGRIEEAETETVLTNLRASTALLETEKTRLTAYTLSIALDPPKQQAVLKKAVGRSVAERRGFADAALAAVMADGLATASEVKFLERLHKALDLPVEAIYTAIHRGGPSATPVAQGGVARGGAISTGAPAVAGTITIDAARLDRVRRETHAVSNLLSNIFVDDGPPIAPASPPVTERTAQAVAQKNSAGAVQVFAGLDSAHAALLSGILAMAEPVARNAFDREARAHRLLPDGALETLNEWAFDHFGDALLEGEDDLSVPAHLRDQLSDREAAA